MVLRSALFLKQKAERSMVYEVAKDIIERRLSKSLLSTDGFEHDLISDLRLDLLKEHNGRPRQLASLLL